MERSRTEQKGVAMGQAAVDLPDPLEKPKPAPMTSADDLLAQLAGDEIDRLLADADTGKEPAPEVAVIEVPALDAAPAPVVEEVEPESAPEVQTGNTERAALAAEELSHERVQLPDSDMDVPLILKPLVWLNWPLERFPDQVRETIGKIAVLTMVNSIAVLAYVIIFRRHH
jgi:hypothetical protein